MGSKRAPPTWTPDKIRLGDLVAWDQNPRASTETQAKRIAQSLTDFGQVSTIAVGPNNEAYDGHQRLHSWLQEHGPDLIVDIRRASRALSIAERQRLVIALHAGAVGQWDADILSGWNTDMLLGAGMNTELLKTLDAERAMIAELIKSSAAGSAADAAPQDDKSEALARQWSTARGQVWTLGSHRLMCGDSESPDDVGTLLQGARIDAVVTDPPYGINLETDYSSMKTATRVKITKKILGGRQWRKVEGDKTEYDPAPVFSLWNAPEIFLFGADYYSDRIPARAQGSWLVWDKRLTEEADLMHGSGFELCWSKRRHKRDVIRVKWAGVFGTEREDTRSRVHPNHKPTELFRRLYERYTKPGQVIADPYCGGGSSVIACEQTGRRCYAMEITPEYVAVTLQRWQDMTGQPPHILGER